MVVAEQVLSRQFVRGWLQPQAPWTGPCRQMRTRGGDDAGSQVRQPRRHMLSIDADVTVVAPAR
jgi:hypothetical protein